MLAELVPSESCEEESVLCFPLVSDGLLIFFMLLDCTCVTLTSALVQANIVSFLDYDKSFRSELLETSLVPQMPAAIMPLE